MHDRTAERNRRRRERILEQYKIGYCMPYCIAFVNGTYENGKPLADKLLTRCYDFKFGVMMADNRYRKWQDKFNAIYHECMGIVLCEGVKQE